MNKKMRFILWFLVFASVMQVVAPLAFNKPGQGITTAKLIRMEVYGHHGAPPVAKNATTIDHAAMGHGAHHDHAAMTTKNDQTSSKSNHSGHEGHEDMECALCVISVMAQHMGHHPLPDLVFEPVKYVEIYIFEPVIQSFEKAYYHIGQPRAPPIYSVA